MKTLADYPHLVKQWHPTNNEHLKPEDFSYGSNKKVWWFNFKCFHSWEASIKSRTSKNSTGCPYCNSSKICKEKSLSFLYPEIASQFHSTKNGKINPNMIFAKSSSKFWWVCDKGHEWYTSCATRTSGKGCPYCSCNKVCEDNCLLTLYPEIAKEWDQDLNGEITPSDVIAGSNSKFWWICNKGHQWQTTCDQRTGKDKTSCPYCNGKRVCKENSLTTRYPNTAKELHLTKNNGISANDIIYGSTKKFWWRCARGHEWKASVNDRTNHKTNCPYCANKKVCFDNCLMTIFPEVAKELHPIKNQNLKAEDIIAKSNKMCWWLCSYGHEWETTVSNRTGVAKTNCPICRESHGEKKIREYFIKNNINFEPQYNLFISKDGKVSKFDFKVIKNGNICFIEYHGQQHYYPVDFGSKEKDAKSKMFLDNLLRDHKKEQYCKDNNIPLLVIPYWEYKNIDRIMNNWMGDKDVLFTENTPKIVCEYQLDKYKTKLDANISV